MLPEDELTPDERLELKVFVRQCDTLVALWQQDLERDPQSEILLSTRSFISDAMVLIGRVFARSAMAHVVDALAPSWEMPADAGEPDQVVEQGSRVWPKRDTIEQLSMLAGGLRELYPDLFPTARSPLIKAPRRKAVNVRVDQPNLKD